MNARQFFDKVSEMREWQKKYFKTHSSTALSRSKQLEKEVDEEIARVNTIIGKEIPKQPNLFGE